MYRYKIGYGSYEDSFFVELEHEKKFTEEDLTEMISEAVVWVIKSFLKRGEYVHGFDDVICSYLDGLDIQTFLVEQKGFQRVKYEATWGVFGWASLFHKDGWGHDRDKLLNRVTDAVNAAGFDKSFDRMVRSDEEMRKQFETDVRNSNK